MHIILVHIPFTPAVTLQVLQPSNQLIQSEGIGVVLVSLTQDAALSMPALHDVNPDSLYPELQVG